MRYNKWLREQSNNCPFCSLRSSEILRSNTHAEIILSRARYHKDHLLVIPKKHIEKMEQLTDLEKKDFIQLFFEGLHILHKKYLNISVVYKEGKLQEIGKSIPHAHFHLIPNLKVGPKKNIDRRIFFNENTYLRKTKEMREELFE